MKIDRLIGIITILLQQDKVTAPELAARFEVSRRTINRDIEDICKAGIPLVTVQGYGGGISIADGYKIEKSLFTADELQSILAGLKGIDSVSKTSYLASLLEKLSSKENRVAAEGIIGIDLASHYQIPLTRKIGLIKEAILNKHPISFRYYYEKGDCRRTIEPYRLVFKWSSWYVFGYCLDRKAFRLFKLNRLWELSKSDEVFLSREIPLAELNFDRFFAQDTIRLKAVFAESEQYRLIEEYGIECYSVLDEKGLLFEREFVSYDAMREWILSFGDKAEVLEPEKLRDDLRRQAENLLEKYRRT
ncbi:YafY family protein [Anaerolentibacter hominis]|uniref:helix-turn-helix transcriptional regulator n=1 Tax=Anaerolentibacter hominis TaxID=3079009 RepID=UPI0031B82B5C